MRWVKSILLTVAGLFLLVLLLAAWVMLGSLPKTTGTIVVSGPSASITVTRNQHGIPYIESQSEEDAIFGLGFVHAQDRFFQMEFMRRLGSGRLAEVLGARAIESDRFMRTLGLHRIAKANLEALNPITQNILYAYADGVNAWLEERFSLLPPELQALQIEPEPWVPADSLVWQKLMSLSLAGNWREELLRSNLLQHLTPAQVRELWPDVPVDTLTTLASLPKVQLEAANYLIEAIDAYAPPTLASNVWAIDGQHTASGLPLLANDPHLSFQAPLVWYLARLAWPGETRVGGTTPGVPFHLIGHNGHVAWGITTTHADLQDLFIEQVTDDGRYVTPSGLAPFMTRKETINVRFDDQEILTVRSTRHGPVVSDLANFNDDRMQRRTVLALSATMLRDDDRSAEGIHRVNHSRSVGEVRNGLSFFDGPQQNFMYADTAGSIAYTAAAKVPVRNKGDGTLPVPGDAGEYDWNGWVPYNELPHALSPEDGRLVNANNRPTPEDYQHLIAASFPEGYRAERILERLVALAPSTATPHDMVDIQLDSRSAMAVDMLHMLLPMAFPKTAKGQEAVAVLQVWDGVMDRNRPEPLLFLAWMDHLKEALLSDELGPSYQNFRGVRPRLIKSILSDKSSWCDDITSQVIESCEDSVSFALDKAMDWLSNHSEISNSPLQVWRWGAFHKAWFSHSLFDFIPGLSSLTAVSIETDGADHTINRGGYRSARGRAAFRHVHGAGLRAVFDFANLEESLFIIALGQSGHPASPHYADLNGIWRDGRTITIPSSPQQATATLVLQPASQDRSLSIDLMR